MVETILKSIINYVIPLILGFLLAMLKNHKKKNDEIKEQLKVLKDANMTQLQSSISNTYFLYEPIGKIPDYLYRNCLNEHKSYQALGGNDYIEAIMHKMTNWEIIRTDILHDKEK